MTMRCPRTRRGLRLACQFGSNQEPPLRLCEGTRASKRHTGLEARLDAQSTLHAYLPALRVGVTIGGPYNLTRPGPVRRTIAAAVPHATYCQEVIVLFGLEGGDMDFNGTRNLNCAEVAIGVVTGEKARVNTRTHQ